MVLVFWLSCVAVAYVYAGYPLLLWAWARLRPLPAARARLAAEPGISIVVAARNEADKLTARIDNLVSQDYGGPRQIVVVSDGSTDATLAVLARYGRTIDVVALPPSGKAVALNAGVAAARHDFLVFADARQTFEPDALTSSWPRLEIRRSARSRAS